MARNEAEYQKLKQLRQAIVNKAMYQQKQQEVSQRLANMGDAKLPAKPEKVACTKYTKEADREYAIPYREEASRRAKRKGTLVSAVKTTVAVLLALGVLALIIWLYIIMTKWLWGISFHKLFLPDGDGSIFTAVHLVALAALFGIAAGILHFIDEIPSGICGGIACILPIVAFFFYWSHVDGIGDFFAHLFLGPFVVIPDFFIAMFAEVLFLLPAAPIVVIIVLACYNWDSIYDFLFENLYYVEPRIDYTAFHTTETYLKAKALDKAETEKLDREYPELLKKYEANCVQLRENHEARRNKNRELVQTYQKSIADCDKVISGATFLHSSYRNVKMIDTILYYIDYNYADTITQAMNVYRDDEHKRQMRALEEDRIQAIKNHTARMEAEARRAREAEEARMARIEAMHEEEMRQRDAIAERQQKDYERECARRNEYLGDIDRKIGYIEDDVYRFTH